MEHPANPDHPIHELFARRYSPRAFGDGDVPAEQLATVLEAARWAASASNEQPWRMIVTTRDAPQERAQLLATLAEGNRVWAQRAPVLILTAAMTRWAHDGSPNRFAEHDLGLATAQLLLQATALGLAVHPMGGFDREQAREAFALPPDVEPMAVIALGQPGDPDLLPDALRARELAPRVRRPQSEWVLRRS